MATWAEREARVNDAVFGMAARACTFACKRGPSFPLRYVERELPEIAQPAQPGYATSIEVLESEFVQRPQRGDQVLLADGTVYLVNRLVSDPLRNPVLVLHRREASA